MLSADAMFLMKSTVSSFESSPSSVSLAHLTVITVALPQFLTKVNQLRLKKSTFSNGRMIKGF